MGTSTLILKLVPGKSKSRVESHVFRPRQLTKNDWVVKFQFMGW